MVATRSRVTGRHRSGNAILKETTLMLNGYIHYAFTNQTSRGLIRMILRKLAYMKLEGID